MVILPFTDTLIPVTGHDSAKNCNLTSMKVKNLDMDQLKAALDKASAMAVKYVR